MRSPLFSLLLLITFFACFFALTASAAESSDDAEQKKQCMPFRDITSISFEPGMTTTRRRTQNRPRMTCVGNCPGNVMVSAAQCQQTGISDNGLPSWKCRGSFTNTAGEDSSSSSVKQKHQNRLGNVAVSCEGCDRSGDSRVIMGSCVLKYSVETRMRGNGVLKKKHWSHHRDTYQRNEASTMTIFDWLILFIIVGGTVTCCCAMMKKREQQRWQQASSSSSAGGGHHDSDDNMDLNDNKYAYENNGKRTGAAASSVHHHHHGGGGGGGMFGGGGGFFSGMLFGSLMGGGLGGGNHTTNYYYGEDSA